MARRPLRWVVLVMGLPVLLIALLMTAGFFLPRDHEAISSARFAAPPDSVWAVISDLERVPSWRPDVIRMDRLPDHDGHAVWLEVGQTGSLPYEVVEWLPPVRLALRVDDPASSLLRQLDLRDRTRSRGKSPHRGRARRDQERALSRARAVRLRLSLHARRHPALPGHAVGRGDHPRARAGGLKGDGPARYPYGGASVRGWGKNSGFPGGSGALFSAGAR